MSDSSPHTDAAGLRQSLRRWQGTGAVVGLLLVLAFPLYLGVEDARRDEALAARQAGLTTMGRELWTQSCASCHGINGEGVDAPALNSKQFLEATTDLQVHHLTASGVPGTEMPAWWIQLGGSMTDEQIQALVAYIRSWEDAAPDRPDWRTPGGMEGDHVGEGVEPTPPEGEGKADGEGKKEPSGREPLVLVVKDRGCEPLEFEVTAGRRFTLIVDNRSSQSVSLDAASLGQHVHTEAGQQLELKLKAEKKGEYPFECLGAAHGTVLGAGVFHAT